VFELEASTFLVLGCCGIGVLFAESGSEFFDFEEGRVFDGIKYSLPVAIERGYGSINDTLNYFLGRCQTVITAIQVGY